jgi:hypothetical protein
MRKFIYLFVALIVVLSSCSKDDPKPIEEPKEPVYVASPLVKSLSIISSSGKNIHLWSATELLGIPSYEQVPADRDGYSLIKFTCLNGENFKILRFTYEVNLKTQSLSDKAFIWAEVDDIEIDENELHLILTNDTGSIVHNG